MFSMTLRQDIVEPRPRRDGKCVVCKKSKPVFDEGDKRAKIYRVDLDPFCSTQCCRKFYDTEDQVHNTPLTRENKKRELTRR